MTFTHQWRGAFESAEVSRLHADAFGSPVHADAFGSPVDADASGSPVAESAAGAASAEGEGAEKTESTAKDVDWRSKVAAHSLGWVTARDGDERLIGFVNVIWDGDAHAWMQDVMVLSSARNCGVGTRLVAMARDAAAEAGCAWLHVDFEERLGPFYLDACGFVPATAGLIQLAPP